MDKDDDSIESIDSLQEFIDFRSHRNPMGLEEAVSFTYPPPPSPSSMEHKQSSGHHPTNTTTTTTIITTDGEQIENDEPSSAISPPQRIKLSTLLEENDLAPLFDGAGWAGTRLWSAAIWGTRYVVDTYHPCNNNNNNHNHKKRMSLCELGCGLGLPGMVWHQLGGNTVLCDQESIMSQLESNVRDNFPSTFLRSRSDYSPSPTPDDDDDDDDDDGKSNNNVTQQQQQSPHTIQTHPLTWSRTSLHTLLHNTSYNQTGFDIVLNCDCVYEPLYGKSWEALVEVIDECLCINPKCVVVTSVERRASDGIDDFLERMRRSEFVGMVERVEYDDGGRNLELYLTKGIR